MNFRQLLRLLLLCPLLILLAGCEPDWRDRPYGDLRLGKIQDLLAAEVFLPDAQLLLRRDERGWSAMSTLCTRDLSILVRKQGPQGVYFASNFSASTYDLQGNVLTGPALKNLPFYELFIDEGVFGGPRDTLYARIGNEKPREWRLPVPAAAGVSQ